MNWAGELRGSDWVQTKGVNMTTGEPHYSPNVLPSSGVSSMIKYLWVNIPCVTSHGNRQVKYRPSHKTRSAASLLLSPYWLLESPSLRSSPQTSCGRCQSRSRWRHPSRWRGLCEHAADLGPPRSVGGVGAGGDPCWGNSSGRGLPASSAASWGPAWWRWRWRWRGSRCSRHLSGWRRSCPAGMRLWCGPHRRPAGCSPCLQNRWCWRPQSRSRASPGSPSLQLQSTLERRSRTPR